MQPQVAPQLSPQEQQTRSRIILPPLPGTVAVYIRCSTGKEARWEALLTAAQMLMQTTDVEPEPLVTFLRSSGGHFAVSMTQEGDPQSCPGIPGV